MHLPINRTSLIYSTAGVLAATLITATFLARLYFIRRRAALENPLKSEVPGEPSVMEELVMHNWKGF